MRLRFSTFDMEICNRRQIGQNTTLAATRPCFGGERRDYACRSGAISLGRGVTSPPLHGGSVGLSAAHYP